MGFMKDNFELPICNSFQATIFRHGLCYEVDLEMHRNRNDIEEGLSIGLVFFMDYNEDRQVIVDENIKTNRIEGFHIVDRSKTHTNAFIILNTIG